MPVHLSVDQQAIVAAGRILADEADGKALRKELQKNMRDVLAPAADEARRSILSMSSKGLPHTEGGSLRQAIASGIKVESRLSGNRTGVRVAAKKNRLPRGFRGAPKQMSRPSFTHPVYGRPGSEVSQTGKPKWFDDTIAGRRNTYTAAVMEAVESMARRIASRSRSS